MPDYKAILKIGNLSFGEARVLVNPWAERAALSMTAAMPPRGLRGLGLLNLLQVSETVGSQNNLSISLTSPLMQRGMCWKLA